MPAEATGQLATSVITYRYGAIVAGLYNADSSRGEPARVFTGAAQGATAADAVARARGVCEDQRAGITCRALKVFTEGCWFVTKWYAGLAGALRRRRNVGGRNGVVSDGWIRVQNEAGRGVHNRWKHRERRDRTGRVEAGEPREPIFQKSKRPNPAGIEPFQKNVCAFSTEGIEALARPPKNRSIIFNPTKNV